MSTFRDILCDIVALIYPDRCMICGEHVERGVHSICMMCRYKIPLTGYCYREQNPVKEYFDALFPTEHCSSMIFYKSEQLWRQAILRFKYKGAWNIAFRMGRWYGSELKASKLYDDVDVIIPVPLYWFKTMVRGYNQSHYIAHGIAKELGVKVDRRTLYRRRNNPSQTTQNSFERWGNVDGIFAVRDSSRLRGKHILLVDDVLTTGATLASCAQVILNAEPTCRVSIVTLAVAGRLSRHL